MPSAVHIIQSNVCKIFISHDFGLPPKQNIYSSFFRDSSTKLLLLEILTKA